MSERDITTITSEGYEVETRDRASGAWYSVTSRLAHLRDARKMMAEWKSDVPGRDFRIVRVETRTIREIVK